MYQNCTCCIETEDGFTDYLSMETGERETGVRQILSPFLFIMVFIKKINKSKRFRYKIEKVSLLSDLDYANGIAPDGRSTKKTTIINCKF